MDGAAGDAGIPRRLEEGGCKSGRFRFPAKLPLLQVRSPPAAAGGARLAGTGGPANAAAGSRVRASTVTLSDSNTDEDAPAALMLGDGA